MGGDGGSDLKLSLARFDRGAMPAMGGEVAFAQKTGQVKNTNTHPELIGIEGSRRILKRQ